MKLSNKVSTALTLGSAFLATNPVVSNLVFAVDEKTGCAPGQKICLDADGNLVKPDYLTENAAEGKGITNAFNDIMDKLDVAIAGFTGVLTIIMVGLFAWKAFQLAKASDNPNERQKCITGMIWFAIGAAIFGSITMFMGLFYNFLG